MSTSNYYYLDFTNEKMRLKEIESLVCALSGPKVQIPHPSPSGSPSGGLKYQHHVGMQSPRPTPETPGLGPSNLCF